MILDLTPGIGNTNQYTAFKFPGGEVHFKFTPEMIEVLSSTEPNSPITVIARINTAETFIMFCLAIDTIRKDFDNKINVFLYYMPYQQADRDFSEGESFSLKTITKLLNTLDINTIGIFDPHSDVSVALLDKAYTLVNNPFIVHVLGHIEANENALKESDEQLYDINRDLTILSPDAGAYKKIFKLCESIEFEGGIETANKYRDTKTGDLRVRLSAEEFHGDVLIIDDICMGGRTFVELAKLIKPKLKGKLYLAVSHGIFSNGIIELGTYFDGIYTTNSVCTNGKFFNETLKIQDLDSYLNIFDLKTFIES